MLLHRFFHRSYSFVASPPSSVSLSISTTSLNPDASVVISQRYTLLGTLFEPLRRYSHTTPAVNTVLANTVWLNNRHLIRATTLSSPSKPPINLNATHESENAVIQCVWLCNSALSETSIAFPMNQYTTEGHAAMSAYACVCGSEKHFIHPLRLNQGDYSAYFFLLTLYRAPLEWRSSLTTRLASSTLCRPLKQELSLDSHIYDYFTCQTHSHFLKHTRRFNLL
jgi:hypothetical protein